jgi:hypothetical protein
MMRAGSSFTPIPHPLLASMFGRRPAPSLRIDVTALPVDLSKFYLLMQIPLGIEISLLNDSLVAAREVFVTWALRESPSGGPLRTGSRVGERLNFSWAGDRKSNIGFFHCAICSLSERIGTKCRRCSCWPNMRHPTPFARRERVCRDTQTQLDYRKDVE